MFKYIIVLCLCISLSGVLCEYLNKREGEQCEWEGLSGKCVQETACFTTLDDDSPKHHICSKTLEDKIICCTDCKLVNNTKNAILTPSGLYWKNGQKARDKCLQYLQELPYKCKGDDFFAGIMRELDEKNKCYGYTEWDSGSSDDSESRAEYPHSALLGFGEDLESVEWWIGGSIISDKYILTDGHVKTLKPVKFVALGVKKLSDGPTAWQVHTVKRVIPHPDYKSPNKYNDIGLIETENTITFNKNVLPACLHVEQGDDETAIITTWFDLKLNNYEFADTIQTIKLDKFSEEECKTVYQPDRNLKEGINFDMHMCYGSKVLSPDACKALLGYGDNIDSAQWLCGGSVISEKYILTAAHCISSPNVGPVKYVALGILKRSDPTGLWQKYNVKRIIAHPEYHPPSKYNDIALLETDTEITFGLRVLPACLSLEPESDETAEATGWGALGHRQELADTLQTVKLHRYDEEKCSQLYPKHRHLREGYNHSSQMCYGDTVEAKDTCEGDSGGPLQTSNMFLSCAYTVLGVTSYGRQCGVSAGSGMYTRVYHYVPWIESIVWP